jgi:hypothetical protein
LINSRKSPHIHWDDPDCIGDKGADVPALVDFNESIYMVYQGDPMETSHSKDGEVWSKGEFGPSTGGRPPAIVAFGCKLWIVFSQLPARDGKHPPLMISHSEDGCTWSKCEQISGQTGENPALVVYDNALFLVYNSFQTNQLWMTQSRNGCEWFNTQRICEQEGNIPLLAVFKNKVNMVYTSDPDLDHLRLSCYTCERGWEPSIKLHFPTTYADIEPLGEYLYMVYSDKQEVQLWVTRTADGVKWAEPTKLRKQFGNRPSVTTFKGRLIVVYIKPDGDAPTFVTRGTISSHHHLW